MVIDAAYTLALMAPVVIMLVVLGAALHWYYSPPSYLVCYKCSRNRKNCSHREDYLR